MKCDRPGPKLELPYVDYSTLQCGDPAEAVRVINRYSTAEQRRRMYGPTNELLSQALSQLLERGWSKQAADQLAVVAADQRAEAERLAGQVDPAAGQEPIVGGAIIVARPAPTSTPWLTPRPNP